MIRMLFAALLALSGVTLHAQTPSESLGRCLGENTTGKDRKDLARWVFLSMAAHPEIKGVASIAAPQAAEESHKTIAVIVTRLLTESCVQQTRAALADGGGLAIQEAFQTLGQLAMRELMTDRDVSAHMAAFEKHLDQRKLAEALRPK